MYAATDLRRHLREEQTDQRVLVVTVTKKIRWRNDESLEIWYAVDSTKTNTKTSEARKL